MIVRGAAMILLLCLLIAFPDQALSQTQITELTDSAETPATQHLQNLSHRTRTRVVPPEGEPQDTVSNTYTIDVAGDTVYIADMDSVQKHAVEAELLQTELQAKRDSAEYADYGRQRAMKINPMRSLWLSALCPGLGQVYNRRYWKLPIVVGGFVGLGYAISWNNKMLKDYSRAYNDAMDNDPNTKSYMDFYPPTVKEEDIDKEWLKRALKSKKDYFRRNRDLCVISIVGVYLICMVDAYVDATLSKFDISDDLSMKVRPTLIEQSRSNLPGVGVACAISF
ncbi:MAG: DUF5683 domain-containing protein [Bacteroidales bacterium]|nr:DUF5683 domain-containing protein [Bacteroidales bacterium]